MTTMMTFDMRKEMIQPQKPDDGKKKASTKTPTIGPPSAPNTLMDICNCSFSLYPAPPTLNMPPRGSPAKARHVEKTPVITTIVLLSLAACLSVMCLSNFCFKKSS